jgi:hypothetical protein
MSDILNCEWLQDIPMELDDEMQLKFKIMRGELNRLPQQSKIAKIHSNNQSRELCVKRSSSSSSPSLVFLPLPPSLNSPSHSLPLSFSFFNPPNLPFYCRKSDGVGSESSLSSGDSKRNEKSDSSTEEE